MGGKNIRLPGPFALIRLLLRLSSRLPAQIRISHYFCLRFYTQSLCFVGEKILIESCVITQHRTTPPPLCTGNRLVLERYQPSLFSSQQLQKKKKKIVYPKRITTTKGSGVRPSWEVCMHRLLYWIRFENFQIRTTIYIFEDLLTAMTAYFQSSRLHG